MTDPRPVQLYFLRHAHAGDGATWQGDDTVRPLTHKGERQAERLGRLLAGTGFRPDALVSSPLVRAQQTAAVVGALLEVPVRLDDRLADLGFAELESLLEDLGHPASVMLVGHDPDFSVLVTGLCDAGDILVRKGTLVRVDAERPLAAGSGTLRWFVPPDLLDPKR